MKKYLLMFLCAGYVLQSFQAQTSTLVTVGSDGKLIYTPDAVGSVIPDFSGVGYKNSEVSIPEVAVVKTVTAVSGDNYSPSTVSNLIPPVQAFWVKSNGGTLTFKNNMRTHETESNRLKARGSSNTVNSPAMPFVRLSVSNGSSTDEAVIYASELASNAFDLYDAPKYFNTDGSNQAQIFTSAGTEKVAINALHSIEAGTALSLGFVTEKTNRFAIKAAEFNNSDLVLILSDNLILAEFDLTHGSSYTFSSDAVNDAHRFNLLFRSKDAATSFKHEQNSPVLVFANASGQIEIHAPAGSAYSVYNAVGSK